MTKEQFIAKWEWHSKILIADFEAVIATEIAKAQESIPQPDPTEKPAKAFDKERFEAMFRAVIETHEATMNALKQLDAYYASKEGGANE